jgi:uncharacterized SAM-binding protein YcdF (DUF218 family)
VTIASDTTLRDARLIWDYHHVHHTLAPADVIIVLGSHDTRVAERGADVFLAGWAPLIVFSGNLGALTTEIWTRPEAEIFAEVAEKRGVPRERMLLEPRATHTGENVSFSRELLAARGIHPRKVIAVQKPYMERRTLATFGQRWPEVEVIVTSPQIAFDDYPRPDITREDVIHIMLGDLQRLTVYGEKGWSARQEIPADVQGAFERLVKAGYTRRLLPKG